MSLFGAGRVSRHPLSRIAQNASKTRRAGQRGLGRGDGRTATGGRRRGSEIVDPGPPIAGLRSHNSEHVDPGPQVLPPTREELRKSYANLRSYDRVPPTRARRNTSNGHTMLPLPRRLPHAREVEHGRSRDSVTTSTWPFAHAREVEPGVSESDIPLQRGAKNQHPYRPTRARRNLIVGRSNSDPPRPPSPCSPSELEEDPARAGLQPEEETRWQTEGLQKDMYPGWVHIF